VKLKPIQFGCQTIDKPNQKMTDEIAMTVPAKYVYAFKWQTGRQKKNADGTRTDTWKMELPHAPYLCLWGSEILLLSKIRTKARK
jgi:aminopeptidase N